MAELIYNGLVIVGRCWRCRMAVWGERGTTKDEHSYCGVTVANPRDSS